MHSRVIWSEDYIATATKFATFSKSKVIAGLVGETVAPCIQLETKDFLSCHGPQYVNSVKTGHPRNLATSNGFDWDWGMYKSVSAHCSGVASAVGSALAHGGNWVTLSSGLHHARWRTGALFCTFNGLAIAVKKFETRKILVLDWDAHCGGGTYSLVARPEHHFDLSTNTLDVTPTSVIVPVMTEYLDAAEKMLADAGTDWDVVLYNAGVDMVYTPNDVEILHQRENMLFAWAARHNLPVAATLAGGYGDLDEVAKLHMITINTAKGYN